MSATLASEAVASATIRTFSSPLQRRRRSGPTRISAFILRTSLRAHLRTSYPSQRPTSTRAPEHRLLWFQTFYVFFAIRHANREVLHVQVTRHATAEWVAQQI